MAKYRYRIEGSNYGGEAVLGKVSAEFVDYYKDKDQEDLIEAVTDFDDWNDTEEPDDALLDPNAPPIPREDYYMWECDDFEHLNSSYADGGFFVYEVPADGSDDYDYDNEVHASLEVAPLMSREAGLFGTDLPDHGLETDSAGNQYVPVLMFHSSEKGSFAVWFVETDEPFDKYKLTYNQAETNMGEFIDDVYYDREMLEADYDYNDTTGKAYYAEVGYLNTKWHDTNDASEEELKEYWQDFDDNVEWEKENE